MLARMSVQHVAGLRETVVEIVDSLTGRTRLTHHFYEVFNCILQLTGSNELRLIWHVSGPVVSDNCVKFGDPRLNYYREIPPEAV